MLRHLASSIKFILLFLLCLDFVPCASFAQSLSGTIRDIDSKKPIPAVLVSNKTNASATFADADGQFSIYAGANDTIEFSYLGYHPVSITMPANAPTHASRNIGMKKVAFTLDDVVIRPGYTPYQLDSIARHKTYQSALERQKERSITSPVSALAENISKKSRQRWRFQKNFAKWEDQKFVDTRYTPELVKELTNIPDGELFAFMAEYPIEPDFARTATELEMKMLIKYNYRQWQKKPNKLVIHPDSLQFGQPATADSAVAPPSR